MGAASRRGGRHAGGPVGQDPRNLDFQARDYHSQFDFRTVRNAIVVDGGMLLRHVCLRPVNDEDVRQIQIMTVDLIARGQVVPLTAENVLQSAPMPAAFDVGDSFNTDLLLKNPMLVDKLPAHVSDIVGYLLSWVRRYMQA